MNLKDLLIQFSGANTIDELTAKFAELAPAFLYGGFIKVGEEYRIYIHTVEFYFHAEEGSKFDIQDPIVYHRDGKYPDRRVPYFSTLSLQAHASGFDITFENETLKYRASALIRAYAIYDAKTEKFLETKEGKGYDDRSTYLYDFLNGFPLGSSNSIKWVDKAEPEPHTLMEPRPRRNVFLYKNGGKSDERDTRPWSFSRANAITIIQ